MPEKIDFSLSTTPANCKDANSASIEIKEVQNAFLPFSIENNGAFFKNIFDKNYNLKNISEGDYSIKIIDANGCELSKNINVAKQIIPNVTLPDDATTYAGDEIQLSAQSNIIPDKIFWTKIFDLSCKDCLNPIAKPTESSTYTIIVTDKYGCQASDEINIDINRDIFAPTHFSPNGDNQNDFFSIFTTKSVAKINQFTIFDRWGNEVFKINDSTNSWDGSFKNSPCQPGVYIYFAEILFKDGKIKEMKGDVTLSK